MTHKGIFRHLSFLRPGIPGAVLAVTILLTLLAGRGASAGDDPVQTGTPGFAPEQNGCSSVLLEQRGKNHGSLSDFLSPASRQIDAPPLSCLRFTAGISAPLRHTPLSSLMLYTQTTASDL
jgi:hypothetical protein